MCVCVAKPVILLFFGAFLILLAIFIEHYAFHAIMHLYLQKHLYLNPESPLWDYWKTFPVYTHFYFFNVTNPDEVKNNGTKPKLKEVGRYSYLEVLEKSNIHIDYEETASYFYKRTYYFQPHLSDGSEDDLVTIANVPLLAMAPYMEQMASWALGRPVANMAIRGYDQKLFVTKSVRELLFEGYYQPVLAHAQLVTGETYVKNNKFAMFNKINDTLEGPLEVHTGQSDIYKSVQMKSFKGSSKMHVWNDENCDTVKGVDGSLFPPFVSREDVLLAFISSLCRAFPLTYEQDVKHRGTSGYRFSIPENVLASPSGNPDNTCFCMQEPCPASGLMDMTPCLKISVLISNPHFYQADPTLLQGVEGLYPNPVLHRSYVDVHPILGAVLQGKLNVQFNVELRKFAGLSDFQHVPHAVLPVVWMSTEIELGDELVNHIYWWWTLPSTSVTVSTWMLVILGVALSVFALWKIPFKKTPEKDVPHRDEYNHVAAEVPTARE